MISKLSNPAIESFLPSTDMRSVGKKGEDSFAVSLKGSRVQSPNDEFNPARKAPVSKDVNSGGEVGKSPRPVDWERRNFDKVEKAVGEDKSYIRGDAAEGPRKVDGPIPKADQTMESADPLSRRAALERFLKKMKEKFGVSAEQIVEAFAKLQPELLLLPPEQTVDSVIEGLGIPKEKQGQARQLFEELFNKGASNSMAEYLKGSGKDISLEVYSKDDLRRRDLNRSLDRMNQMFFVDNRQLSQGAVEGTQKVAGQQAYSAQPGTEELRAAAVQGGSTSPASTLSPVPAAQPNAITMANEEVGQEFEFSPRIEATAPNIEGLDNSAPREAIEAKGTLDEVEEFSFDDAPEVAAPSLRPKVDLQQVNAEAPDVSLPEKLDGNLQTSGMEGSRAAAPTMVARQEAKGGPSSDDSRNGRESQTDSVITPADGRTSGSQAVNKADSFVVKAPQTGASDEQANVREIVNQASFMAKNGGGEVKIRLQPEGLGEVVLKVSNHGGMINVDLITDNTETKKILERGLGDLKATLASHKLNVEMIRVDANKELSSQMEAHQDQANRHFAQQFMAEFRNGNDARRNDFFEPAGPRELGSQTDKRVARMAALSNAKSKPVSSRRLDLVA